MDSGIQGKQYEKTRHNIGFHVIDELAKRLSSPPMQSKFNGMYTVIHRPEGKVMLVKPLTYMNLSGECVRPLMDYYDVEIDQISSLFMMILIFPRVKSDFVKKEVQVAITE